MALARVTTWNPGDTLTAAALNGEFNNILNNPISLISPSTGAINFQTSVAHTNLTPSALTASSGGVNASLIATSSGVSTWTALPVPGQCRLQYVTSSGIRLTPYQGNLVPVKSSGGVWGAYPITSSGIDLSSTNFTVASSMSYVYIFSSTGVLTLVRQTSSFSHAPSTDLNGVEVMTTDPTRTLVGMVFTSTTAQNFSTVGVGNLVASWFNLRPAVASAGLTANVTPAASTAYSEVSTALQVPYLVWATETASIRVLGGSQFSAAPTVPAMLTLGIDSSTTPEDCQITLLTTIPGNVQFPISIVFEKTGLAEGKHDARLLYGNSTGTLTVLGGAVPDANTPTGRTTLAVSVWV